MIFLKELKVNSDLPFTFTIEKCIQKYGEEKGIEIFNERQEKWSKIMEDKYKNGEYIRVSESKFSKAEVSLMGKIIDLMGLNENEYRSINNGNVFFNSIDGNVYSYDFLYKNKIIEFQGNYWHCNPIFFNENYFHKHRKLTAKDIWEYDKTKKILTEKSGYKILYVWENEYENNEEKIIEKCINFLKNN